MPESREKFLITFSNIVRDSFVPDSMEKCLGVIAANSTTNGISRSFTITIRHRKGSSWCTSILPRNSIRQRSAENPKKKEMTLWPLYSTKVTSSNYPA